MDADKSPVAHPLQLGQVLYAVNDTSLIFVPPGGKGARFQQVSFGGTTEAPKPVIHDAVDIGAMEDIVCARAVTRFGSGKQEAVILGSSGLSVLKMKGTTAAWETVPGRIANALHVIGFDPADPESSSLVVLAGEGLHASTTGEYPRYCAVVVNLETGAAKRFALPSQVQGVVVAAEFLRHGMSAALVLGTSHGHALHVHALTWKDLAERAESAEIQTVQVGPIAEETGIEIGTAVARMRASSSDQQIAFALPNMPGACQVSLIGWTDEEALAVLATAPVDLAFATADRPSFRLAAADLAHNGVEQLVLGYPATHGSVRSCAALSLFSLEEIASAPAFLKHVGSYAITNTGNRPFASYDLHVDAGIFGTCFGVQVIGASASLKQLSRGEASVSYGFVGIDVQHGGFPPMPSDGSAAHLCAGSTDSDHLLGAMNTEARKMLAFRTDLSGNSIVLGPPKFETRSGRTQLLAYVQAPPFDRRTVDARPTLSITTVKGSGSGCSVSDDKSYTVTNDTTFNLGLDTLSVSRSMHDMYGDSFSKMKDTSVSRNVTLHKNFADADHVLIYAVSYDVWRYPVIRQDQNPGASDSSPTEVIVVIPQDEVRKQNWTPAHELAYRPRSEIGLLLSYVDQPLEGFDKNNQIFMSDDVLTVSTERDSSSITFDQSNITNDTNTTHFNVMNTISDHLTWTAATELFEVLPVTFGLNVGHSTTDSASHVKTTHMTVHSSLTISVTSGSVKDPTYEYALRPIVYRHAKLGCLMLTWNVEMTGLAWKHGAGQSVSLTSPELHLIRPVLKVNDPVLNCFSRSISFVDKKDGTFDVQVEIFNNGTGSAKEVSCDFYEGRPFIGEDEKLHVPEHKFGNVPVEGPLPPLARHKLHMNIRPQSMPLSVTVQLLKGKSTGTSFIYWGIHPAERYFD